MRFDHVTLAQRVLFGFGQADEDLDTEVTRRAARRVMVVAAPEELALAHRVCARIDVATWFDDVEQHVPKEKAEAARAAAAAFRIDLLVSVGGGSTVGLAKAVALTTGIPIVAVPTTYAGSEATNVWGITDQRTKHTGADDRVLPATVIYDAELTLCLPERMSVVSGLNALAHCVDSLWAPHADPINQALALGGARALASALPAISQDPGDRAARERSLYGCYLAGVAFASAGSGLHHKICHVLGGTFGLPHAQTHAIVLPHVLALNGPAAPEPSTRLAEVLGAGDPDTDVPSGGALATLNAVYRRVRAPRRLADLGFTEADIPPAARRVVASAPTSNPAPVDEQVITAVLTDALNGSIPSTL